MGAFLRLFQFKLRPANDYAVPVTYKIFDELLEVQQPGSPVHQSNIVYREGALQRRVFEQTVEHYVGHGANLQLYDYTHAGAVALVIHKRYAFQPLVFHQLGNLFNELAFVHHVWDLSHHDGFTAAGSHFYIGFGTYHNTAAARLIGIAYTAGPVNNAPGGEIGPLNML